MVLTIVKYPCNLIFKRNCGLGKSRFSIQHFKIMEIDPQENHQNNLEPILWILQYSWLFQAGKGLRGFAYLGRTVQIYVHAESVLRRVRPDGKSLRTVLVLRLIECLISDRLLSLTLFQIWWSCMGCASPIQMLMIGWSNIYFLLHGTPRRHSIRRP